MNKFVTRTKPLSTKQTTQKRSHPNQSPSITDENTTIDDSVEKVKKVNEPTILEKIQTAIREENAQFTFDVLSKNRPFDQAMNKTMTKIEFVSSYSDPNSEFMLLAIDESVVTAFKEGQTLTIRGETTDDAVLCTDVSTFPIKIIESATTILLMQNVLEPPDSPTIPNFEYKNVDGKCFSMGELCPPVDALNIGRLKDLLREQELKWDWKAKEGEETWKGYRLEELLETVQMSVGEVKIALKDLPVVKFSNGKYRFLSHKFRGEMLGELVDLLDEGGEVSIENMTFTGLRANLSENVPDEVIKWFLSSRCELISEGIYRLPEQTLIRDLSIVVLYGTQKMPLQQFRDLLQKILPFGIQIDDGVFEGTADISDAPFGKLISYLSPEDLPDTSKDRMIYLLKHRKLWSMEQLRPYFGDIYKSKVSFDKFVVQNCDYTLSDNGEMLYCGFRN